MSQQPKERRVLVRNASDPEQVKRGRETERQRRERELNDDLAVWSTPAGRAHFRRLLARCGVYRISMASDPYWTAYNEGARNVGLELLARITTEAPEHYLAMEREHAERERHEPRAPERPSAADSTDDTPTETTP